ncbi:MAG: rhomboid family intramembrane serine protease [Actinomycetota bacterium]
MHQASVGFHCPECVRGTSQQVFRGAPVFDPIVTKVLIGLNVIAFLFSLSSARADIDFGLLAQGFVRGEGFIGVAEGEYYRFVSSGFMHAGMFHLAFNMYALWILGPQLERVFDRPRFIALYFASMLGGATGVMLLDPNALTVGASGAIFGLFGAIAVIQRSMGINIWSSGLGPILGLNLLITFTIPQISVGGHVGGLVIGAVVGGLYIAAIRAKQSEWMAVAGAVVITAILAFASIQLALNPL